MLQNILNVSRLWSELHICMRLSFTFIYLASLDSMFDYILCSYKEWAI